MKILRILFAALTFALVTAVGFSLTETQKTAIKQAIAEGTDLSTLSFYSSITGTPAQKAEFADFVAAEALALFNSDRTKLDVAVQAAKFAVALVNDQTVADADPVKAGNTALNAAKIAAKPGVSTQDASDLKTTSKEVKQKLETYTPPDNDDTTKQKVNDVVLEISAHT